MIQLESPEEFVDCFDDKMDVIMDALGSVLEIEWIYVVYPGAMSLWLPLWVARFCRAQIL